MQREGDLFVEDEMYSVRVVDALGEKDHPPSYAVYKAGEMTYMVGSRANAYNWPRDLFNTIDGWISVTDTPQWFKEKTDFMWFPWDEGKACPPEVLYSVIHTLTMWQKFRNMKTFYIHCDAGTHRAPTVFGAWLLGRYGRDEAEKIVKGHTLVYREHLSDPVKYIGYHLHDYPTDLVLIKEAAKTILNRYDGIMSTMKSQFQGRYLGKREI
jgi:hypothetical protein